MVLNTGRLFRRLLRTLEIETVCDVGSMDGSDALLFRHMVPRADILALEPNPRNFALMEADEELHHEAIRIFPLAASDRDSEAPFYVVDADYALHRDRMRRGMSSLYRRSDGSGLAEVVQVRTVRLDSLLSAEWSVRAPIALWIDTEGMAFEVISGTSGLLESTQMLHVEVETEPCIGADQRLFADVEKILLNAGFVLLATDQPHHALQFNTLFVRADLFMAKAGEIRSNVRVERLLWNAKRVARWLLPRRVRRFLARRLAETRYP